MDLRKQKTRYAIKRAFLRLRGEKNLEQITVKELSQLAQISKATFYLHYRDIFDLSEQLQTEAIQKVISNLHDPMVILEDLARFMRELAAALDMEEAVLQPLFSGSQAAALPINLEVQLKRYIFEQAPQLRDNKKINIQLSYHIQGGYYAFMENAEKHGKACVLDVIEEIQTMVSIMSVAPIYEQGET